MLNLDSATLETGDIATETTRDSLILHVGNSSFNLGDAALASNLQSVTWTSNVPTWANTTESAWH